MATLQVKKNGKIASIDPKLKDRSKDPFVLKKVEAAKELIKKFGLPKELRK